MADRTVQNSKAKDVSANRVPHDLLSAQNVKENGSILRQVGLSLKEFEAARRLMGRDLSIVELGMFGAMWSEHCAYKSSKIHLKKLPTKGPFVLQGPGENAGAVLFGEDLALVFKIESHNHPSAVEPFQGAATGVGGIIRDIFTMGARPIVILDSLRFGRFDDARNRYLFHGVVGGIAHYGNCIGIPTVGGELAIDESYSQNPLVNVFCLGVVKPGRIRKAVASGPGNLVVLVGARTGRDGIQGATFASRDLDEDLMADRPAVQVGDPFMEKLLLEAILQVSRFEGVIGIQDLGAAGLTSSSVEMSHRGGVGMEIDLNAVTLRTEGLTPYEMMLSESQERMLLVVTPEALDRILDAFRSWDLDATVIGTVTRRPNVTLWLNGKVMADIPVNYLTDNAPVYERETREPEHHKHLEYLSDTSVLGRLVDRYQLDSRGKLRMPFGEILKDLISLPELGDKSPIYRQYDHSVRTNTLIGPGGDAALVRTKDLRKSVAVSVDGNGRYCRLDPYIGTMLSVLEGVRNVMSVGAEPVGITNCLNFGNPEDPEVMWQFQQAVSAMADALGFLSLPVVSGNVSFYNETPESRVIPTPVIGTVGILEDYRLRRGIHLWQEGEEIAVLGTSSNRLDGSIFASEILGLESGMLEYPNLSNFTFLSQVLGDLTKQKLLLSSHDIADGGLGAALLEMCLEAEMGIVADIEGLAERNTNYDTLEALKMLFSESGQRFIISFDPRNHLRIEAVLRQYDYSDFQILGRTTGRDFIITFGTRVLIDEKVKHLKEIWKKALLPKSNGEGNTNI